MSPWGQGIKPMFSLNIAEIRTGDARRDSAYSAPVPVPAGLFCGDRGVFLGEEMRAHVLDEIHQFGVAVVEPVPADPGAVAAFDEIGAARLRRSSSV